MTHSRAWGQIAAPYMSRWTPDEARSAWQKSAQARKERAALTSLAHAAAPLPEPEPDYPTRRLFRVRAQLDLVDKRILEEAVKPNPDGQLLNWLASAQERLSDQERCLDGRPLPGSRRPAPEPAAPRAASPQAVPLPPSPAKQGEPAPAVSEHLPSSRPALHRAPLPKVEHPSTPSDQEAPDQPIDYGPLD